MIDRNRSETEVKRQNIVGYEFWKMGTCVDCDANWVNDQAQDEGPCGTTLDFPVHLALDNLVIESCTLWGGNTWCQTDDGSYIVCPDSFMELIADPTESQDSMSSGSEEVDVTQAPQAPDPSPASDANTTSVSSFRAQASGVLLNGPVIISELMSSNTDTALDDDGKFPDWLELYNNGTDPVQLGGWMISDKPDLDSAWTFPPEAVIEAGEYLLLWASGKDRPGNGQTVFTSAPHLSFKLKSEGEFLALFKPDGSVAFAMDPSFPPLPSNTSFGVPLGASAHDGELLMATLEEPTPGKANSAAARTGPVIVWATNQYEPLPVPGQALEVHAQVLGHLDPVTACYLNYRVAMGDPKRLPMHEVTQEGQPLWEGIIPAAVVKPGSLVQWHVMCMDSAERISKLPAPGSPDDVQYFGTMVSGPAVNTTLPILHWFCPNPSAGLSRPGHQGSAIYFEGKYYDNVFTRRRGMTALSWQKPKVKIDFHGEVFDWHPDAPKVEEINLQSLFSEPGEQSYMREPVALQVFREAGVPASLSRYVYVILNGEFLGLYALVEQIDTTFLKRNQMPLDASLWKSSAGQMSNLRWDMPKSKVQWAYSKATRKDIDESQVLWGLMQALGGGGQALGLGTRSQFVFSHLDLPQIINEMAAQTLLLHQDRCTKNWLMVFDRDKQLWSRLPWDLEGALGISSSLGGLPASDYCILECEQWNSPLYCDSDHPQGLQDILVSQANSTASGPAEAPSHAPENDASTLPTRRRLQLYSLSASLADPADSMRTAQRLRRSSNVPSGASREERFESELAAVAALRRLRQRTTGRVRVAAPLPPRAPPLTSRTNLTALPQNNLALAAQRAATPPDTAGVDVDRTHGPSPTGVAGTFNHLTDAILDIPRTRSMYLRRLRTLMDRFMHGRIQEIVADAFIEARTAAALDNERWGGGDIERGYRQLFEEQLPQRKAQLFSLYSQSGTVPLIPDTQEPSLAPGVKDFWAYPAPEDPWSFATLVNDADTALDISGWTISGALNLKLPEGCVIPPRDEMFIASSVAQMRRRTTHPRPLSGYFIIGDATVDINQQLQLRITDASGTVRVDAVRGPF